MMEELSTEEKAKRYDEAIKNAKDIYTYECDDAEQLRKIERMFPELKESEDERIRKDMIETIKKESKDFPSSVIAEKSKSWLAYLEKQEVTKDKDAAISFLKSTGIINENGELADEYKIEQDEQKPVDYENVKPQSSAPMSYGKELEKRMNEACHRFFAPNTDNNRYSASDLFYAGVKAERDLNISAWSEEDEKIINDLLWIIEAYRKNGFNETHKSMADKSENWLKSIKDRIGGLM